VITAGQTSAGLLWQANCFISNKTCDVYNYKRFSYHWEVLKFPDEIQYDQFDYIPLKTDVTL